jgi:hypothetical protein
MPGGYYDSRPIKEDKMEITTSYKIKQLKIKDAPALGLINVYLEDIADGKGRVIIECYGQFWGAYWNAMGDRKIHQFFLDVDNDYLIDNIAPPRIKVADRKCLNRIIDAVKEAFLMAKGDLDL